MNLLLIIALILNLIIVYYEIYTLKNIKIKINILKYYTFFQNFITLISSIILVSYIIISIILNIEIPEYIRGIRYISVCGLIFTTFIYVTFLSQNKNNLLCENDFLNGFSPQKANMILHYICPITSFISFTLFERKINLLNDFWTAIVAIPSYLYWIIYLLFTILKIWKKPPYEFSKSSNKLIDIIIVIIIPVSFITISYIIWNIK